MTSAEQVELLPCPLCNASLHWHPPHVLNTGHWTHPTGACALRAFVLSADDAEAWNHRASLAPVSPQPVGDQEVLRCQICGFVVDARYEAERPSIEFTMAGRMKPRAHPDAEAEQRGRLAAIEEAAKVADEYEELSRLLPLASDEANKGAEVGQYEAAERIAKRIRALAQPQESSL